MPTRWLEIPFAHHFVNFKEKSPELLLPFAVGGATQQGTEHILDNHNNQDALSIQIGGDILLGIVCDGCAGTHEELKDSFSNNEVGAKLLTRIIISNLQKLLKKNLLREPDLFVKDLSDKTSFQLISLVKRVAGKDEKEREHFIFDFLMSTILGFVVTRENYLIFSCGDGIIGLNNKISVLKESGSYFTASILPKCCPTLYTQTADHSTLKIFKHGPSSELFNVFLASDGFTEIAQNYKQVLVDFISTPVINPKIGFDLLLRADFRTRILQNRAIEHYSSSTNWPRDDASFLILRRSDSNLESVAGPQIEQINQGITK